MSELHTDLRAVGLCEHAVTTQQLAETGEPWRRMGPSALAAGAEWSVPVEMSLDDIAEAVQCFEDAARRATIVGFDVLELHLGHGYLAASFLSPKSNHRIDEYGGKIENRMRLSV